MRLTAALAGGLLAATAAFAAAPAASADALAVPGVTAKECRDGGGEPRLWGWVLKCTGGIHHGQPIT
ncbi:hypothetical protein [Bailinhaonella thermotolerans]|uniref:Uncharacterized protein n=1 Tax=Bailinhaonella thermotolerans TaxID=1070861 RepID=A0A3A4BRY9_9ACTN|nr:hypothetical protein [Bailinhaonella thermotolerans]RJL34096.1 hypothetical protein D5H75_06295 [Bailinhaonella thermotolerans]